MLANGSEFEASVELKLVGAIASQIIIDKVVHSAGQLALILAGVFAQSVEVLSQARVG